ncbi:MAG: hypothetical protein C0187_05610 [Calditerrivibrio nitroreducens]|uniref:Uncharacterized protein n=1 Tax=Calditerrivibrio nitroreducens TaxID=477976 RepID=A0A2J6WJ71_9BACT|nr:MAG: hypothetical protein C0187_05610 [Calditerrivibrio nitroreducens]
MKKFFYFIFTLLSVTNLFAADCSIIVISIDALHPDAINIVKPENIGKVMSAGVYNLNGKSVNPPKTLISHTAMVTGKTPEESGYISNSWEKGRPFFMMQKEQDLKHTSYIPKINSDFWKIARLIRRFMAKMTQSL